MAFLAIETSSNRGSLALFSAQAVLAESFFPEGLIHGREIAPRIEEVLAAAGLKPSALQAVCVSLGPGSFTGLRVGVTAAKSLAFALRIPVLGVSSLSVIAGSCLEGPQPAEARVLAVIDGRKGLFFAAAFEVSKPRAASDQRVVLQQRMADGLYRREDLLREISRAWPSAAGTGRGRREIVVVGESADAFLGGNPSASDFVRGPPDRDVPRARTLARLTAADLPGVRLDLEAVHRLEPSYLRLSDAEIKRGCS